MKMQVISCEDAVCLLNCGVVEVTATTMHDFEKTMEGYLHTGNYITLDDLAIWYDKRKAWKFAVMVE